LLKRPTKPEDIQYYTDFYTDLIDKLQPQLTDINKCCDNLYIKRLYKTDITRIQINAPSEQQVKDEVQAPLLIKKLDDTLDFIKKNPDAKANGEALIKRINAALDAIEERRFVPQFTETVNKVIPFDPNVVGERMNKMIWEHQTMGYLCDIIRSTWILFKPEKVNSQLLKSGSYLHSLLNYVCNLCLDNEGKPETIEDLVPKLKAFSTECRERFVNSLENKRNRVHQVLNPCPQKYLAQISTWHKAFPVPYSKKLDLAKWIETFAPTKERTLELAAQTIPGGIEGAQNLHRISDILPRPANTAWVARSGCLERNIVTGGTLSMILARIPPAFKEKLFTLGILEQIQELPAIYQTLWKSCLLDLSENGYDHECSYQCNKERHTPILHLLVSMLGWKNRHLSMNYSALQFCASVIQKYTTSALRNMPITAEAMEPKPDWIASINEVYRKMTPSLKAKKSNRTPTLIYIMSGDLEGCTNRYLAEVSRALTRRLLKAHDPVIKPDFEAVIRASLGRYDIFFDGPEIQSMRENTDAREASEQLMDIEDNPQIFRIKQTIGQHMSSSLSFPVMGAMHQAVYDTIIPEADEDLQNALSSTTRRKDKQFLRRMMQGGLIAKYIYGIDNNGYPTTNYFVEVGKRNHYAVWENRALLLLNQVQYDVMQFKMSLPIQMMAQLQCVYRVMDYKEAKKEYGLPRKEKENPVGENIEFKGVPEMTVKRWGMISSNEVLNGTEITAAELCRTYEARRKRPDFFDDKEEFFYITKKGITTSERQKPVVEVMFLVSGSRDRSCPILYTSDSKIRYRTFSARQIPDGLYRLVSMTFRQRVQIEGQEISKWLGDIEYIQAPLHAWSVGDDHLLVSRYMDLLEQYKKETVDSYNQLYSIKANYISDATAKGGLVIAERLGRIDRRMRRIYPQIYVKIKQLVTERMTNADSSWMERSPAIKTQLYMEFHGKQNVSNLELWQFIEKAQEILYINNEKAIKFMAATSIDPRLPIKLGGQDVWRNADFEMSEITIWHLRLIDFYSRIIPELLPIYIKGIRKRVNRFRTTNKDKGRRKFYKKGNWPVPRKEFKELLFSLVGFVSMIDTEIETTQVNYRTVAIETRDYIRCHYSLWEPTAADPTSHQVKFVSKEMEKLRTPTPPSILEDWIKIRPKNMTHLPMIDSLLKVVDEDSRQLYVDLDTFKLYSYLLNEKDKLIESTSRIRGELLTDEKGIALQPGNLDFNINYKAFKDLANAQHWDYIMDRVERSIALNL
jgi:hypothetical protein